MWGWKSCTFGCKGCTFGRTPHNFCFPVTSTVKIVFTKKIVAAKAWKKQK